MLTLRSLAVVPLVAFTGLVAPPRAEVRGMETERFAPTPRGAMPGRARNLLLIALLLAAGVAVPLAAAAQPATPAAEPYRGTPSTAIVASATNDPLAVLGSDGMRHLEYDLLVTNTNLAPVQLSAVDVRAPDGTRLQRLEGEALLSATQPILGSQDQPDIPVAGTVAIVMDVVVAPDLAVDRLAHTIAYTVPPDAPDQALIGSRETVGPDLPVAPLASVVITPPLAGDGWLAVGGCCAASSVHRFLRVAAGGTSIAKPEMFAIDWMQLRDERLYTGDGSRVEDYFGYGAEVRAVAAGTVVYVRDGMLEQVPGGELTSLERPEDFGGNQVMVEIAPDRYAWYAHLQPGSVLVAVGDRVTVGQPLGRLGNTGNSTAPHLHFGLLDAPNPVSANGVPRVLDRYELAGLAAPEALLSQPPDDPAAATPAAAQGSVAGTPAADFVLPINASARGAQTETLPLYLTVADFP